MTLKPTRYPTMAIPVGSDPFDPSEVTRAFSQLEKNAAFDPYIHTFEIQPDKWNDKKPAELETAIPGYHIEKIPFSTSGPQNHNCNEKMFTHAFGTICVDNTADNIQMTDVASKCTVLITDITFQTSDNSPREVGQPYYAIVVVQARTGIPERDVKLEVWFW
jgi:hypothetical protein